MDLNNYLKSIKLKPANLYLVTGDEPVLFSDLRNETKRIAKLRNATFIPIDLTSDSSERFLVEFENSSLFSSERIIYVSNFFSTFKKQFSDKQVNILINKLQTMTPDVTLIFNSYGENIDGRTKVNKLIQKESIKVELTKISAQEVQRKLQNYFKSKSYEIEPGVIQEILLRTHYDYTILRSELLKLDLLMIDRPMLKVEDVKQLITTSFEDNIFDLVTKINQQNFDEVFEMYSDLINYYGNPIPLNSLLLSNFRLLTQVKILQNRGFGQSQIVKKLKGIHPYRVKLSMQNGSLFSIQKLLFLTKTLIDMDIALKTSSVQYDELFSDFILKIRS